MAELSATVARVMEGFVIPEAPDGGAKRVNEKLGGEVANLLIVFAQEPLLHGTDGRELLLSRELLHAGWPEAASMTSSVRTTSGTWRPISRSCRKAARTMPWVSMT